MRATDDNRERIVKRLKRGYAAGALSFDSFTRRVEAAYSDGSVGQLERLVADLPASRWSDLREVIAQLFRRPARPAQLSPPRLDSGSALVIGREASCDLALTDPTVSRRHAQLRRERGSWIVVDLGSMNGTRVNGWRVSRAVLQAGDEVELGSAQFRFKPPI